MSRLAFAVAGAFAAFLLPSGAFAKAGVAEAPAIAGPTRLERGSRAEVAAGATIATGPATAPLQLATDDPFLRFSFKIDGGVAIIERDTVGGFARLGGEVTIVKDLQRSRFVWGFWDAYEGWIARGAGGFALPIVAYVGYRKAPFLATLGGGLNVFTVDHLDDDTGVGIFSPRGELRVGLDLGSFVAMADSSIQYRWLWGRDDISLIQVGLSIGIGPGFQREEPPRRRN